MIHPETRVTLFITVYRKAQRKPYCTLAFLRRMSAAGSALGVARPYLKSPRICRSDSLAGVPGVRT
jgi:hypothetical protein